MASLSPLIRQRFFDANGAPLAGGKLYSYAAGTSTPKATFTDATGFVANPNPVILDANGYADVWLSGNYKFTLSNSLDVVQWTVDNVSAASSSSTASFDPVVNLITYGSGETTTNVLFNVYNDGAVTRPVDGTGGATTVTSATTTTSPLAGTTSQSIAKTATNSQGQGWSVDFVASPAYRNRPMQVSFDYIVQSGTFAPGSSTSDGDVVCVIYDITNNTNIEPSTIKLTSSSTSVAGNYSAIFQASATGANYRLCLHVASTSASAFSLMVDNVSVAPSINTDSVNEVTNLGVNATVAANALTIAIKDKRGNDPTNANPIKIGMRSPTLTSGLYFQRTLAAAQSLVVPSGATLGTSSGIASLLFVYLIDNNGTLELAISRTLFSEDQVVSTTAISAASGTSTVMYSTSARTGVAFRVIGKIAITEATAGTWASAPTVVTVGDYASLSQVAPTVTKFLSGSGTYTVPAGVEWLRVKMSGGGSGGAGSGNSGAGNSSAAGNSTFGSFATANGGGATTSGIVGGAGGSATISAPAIGLAIAGGTGNSGGFSGTTGGIQLAGASGGSNPLGGAGAGGAGSGATGTTGLAAQTNSGAGGGGAGVGTTAGSSSGAGGGAGGYCEFIVPAPLAASYAYAVGAASAGGAAGTNGSAGGAGGAGYIEITENY